METAGIQPLSEGLCLGREELPTVIGGGKRERAVFFYVYCVFTGLGLLVRRDTYLVYGLRRKTITDSMIE